VNKSVYEQPIQAISKQAMSI